MQVPSFQRDGQECSSLMQSAMCTHSTPTKRKPLELRQLCGKAPTSGLSKPGLFITNAQLDQEKFASSCALAVEISRSEEADIDSKRGASAQQSCAHAQAKFDMPCASNCATRRTGAAFTDSVSGQGRSWRVANAQAVLESSWLFKWKILGIAA